MSILSKIGNGRLIHGWNKTQTDQEIAKGRLKAEDLVLLRGSNEIYAFGQTWGGKSPDKAKLEGFPLMDLPKRYEVKGNTTFNGAFGKNTGIVRNGDIIPPTAIGNNLYFIGTDTSGKSYKYLIPEKESTSGEGTLVALADSGKLFSRAGTKALIIGEIGLLTIGGGGDSQKVEKFYQYDTNTWVNISETGGGGSGNPTYPSDLLSETNQVYYNLYNPSWEGINKIFQGELIALTGDASGYLLTKFLVKLDLVNNTLLLTKLLESSRVSPSSTPKFDVTDSIVVDQLGKLIYIFQPRVDAISVQVFDLGSLTNLYTTSPLPILGSIGSGPNLVIDNSMAQGFMHRGSPLIMGQFMYDPIINTLTHIQEYKANTVVIPIWERDGIANAHYFGVNPAIFLEIYGIWKVTLNLPITSEDTIVSAIQKLGYSIEENRSISEDLWKELEGVNNAMTELEIVSQ